MAGGAGGRQPDPDEIERRLRELNKEIGRPPVHEPSSLERLVAAKQAKKGPAQTGHGGPDGAGGRVRAPGRRRAQRTETPDSLRQDAHWIRGFMTFRLARRTRTAGADGADVT